MANALWKGKEREELPEMENYENLNPVITYRHLLSSGLGVRNPLRVIGLCDMDAFYAACEQNRLGIDPNLPLVVRQWDALIAVNYPARTFGISRMDKVSSALERCPHLQVVHVATFDPSAPDAKPTYTNNPNSETHKVSLDYYRKESKKIIEIFKDVLTGAEIERASIDEAFVDLTEPIRQYILTRFPHLSEAPSEGLDSPLPPPPREGILLSYPPSRATSDTHSSTWTDLGTLVPVSIPIPVSQPSNKPTAAIESTRSAEDHGNEENRLDNGEGPSTPKNLSSGERSRSSEIEYLSEGKEEQDSHSVSGDEEQAADIPVDTPSDEGLSPTWHDVALSIGASLMLRMRDEVKQRLGYTTSAGIARNKFLAKLVASYKKRDNQTILRNAAIPNYLRTLPFQKIRFLGGKLGTAIAEEYDAQTVGDLLSISVEEIRRKFGESNIWVWEVLRGIDRSEVKEKPSVTKSMGASKNLQHPVMHPSEGAHWLRILAGELAFRLTEAREENPGLWPKTLVLHVTRSYQTAQSRQAPFPFTRNVTTDYICKAGERLWTELVGTAAQYDRNMSKGNVSAMKITNIFLGFSGVETVAAGQRNIEGFFSPNSKRKAEESSHTVMDEGAKRRRQHGVEYRDQAMGHEHPEDLSSVLSFRCPRCGKTLRQSMDDLEDRENALRILKMEHDDFHFAQDLAKEGGGLETTRVNKSSTPKKRTQEREPKGIAKFFMPISQKEK